MLKYPASFCASFVFSAMLGTDDAVSVSSARAGVERSLGAPSFAPGVPPFALVAKGGIFASACSVCAGPLSATAAPISSATFAARSPNKNFSISDASNFIIALELNALQNNDEHTNLNARNPTARQPARQAPNTTSAFFLCALC